MIIVTGGTGYIGSHTVVELLQQGYEVVIFDNLSNSRIETLDAIAEITGKRPQFLHVNIEKADELADAFKKVGGSAQAVIHFAAKKAVGESTEEPLLYYQNNVVSLINLLVQMEQYGVRDLVFSSSCTVYGQPEKFPVTESTERKEAESPYGNTKSICEDIIRDTAKVKNLRGISLRYFNPIGAHESGLIGELPIGIPNNLVPYVTQTAAGIRQMLTVHGDDYPTPDGTCIRDYIHVVDLAKAHLKALERLQRNTEVSAYEVFNIGTGRGSSVLEVIETFIKANHVDVPYKIGARRAGDITSIYADTAFANEQLGWKAELTLEDSLRSSWNWEQKYRAKEA